ncbi:cytochrome P450 [Mycolicibacterium phlei]|jgi:cytochrome P450|uniref:Steroid C26-monooxygenase n=1 Tax=Mycolicibacterium phlei DSM 43239 = CCUG 21000 TaxID=1226750 RepID=A0A5N5UVX7_MYCPH|nr:cytochrome P450 [Mycolicibacterium phlei]VEG09232.1 cytochrome P450 [Mycobacteroides chelonae]AMO61116.1 Cytochrome P450 130 [Mycolicibacterium phlei]EID08917.1 cytochrome P450 [Mycolicibacterium phlei RIVM601174]KAB7752629.1 cytochrome P450 [Mycolicibacterium phlei DSM 43239 = CCUG 21000]KXW60982.1 cytochrome P450 [Mycolicibacterium phlei DSM 43239 = CCUG 21000]
MTAVDEVEEKVYYDPYRVDIVADPYPIYERLREEAPLYYNEQYNFWALSRFEDVERALLDWQTFSNSRSDILELIQSSFDMPQGVMMFQDPPVHTRLRGLMSRVFTPRRMAEIEDQIRRYCINCLDPLVGADRFDIIAELAAMMPMRVIGMLLGIPESDQVQVRDQNDANLRTKPGEPMKVKRADKIADGSIYAEYVDWRAKNPSDDLMTALLNIEFEDEDGVTRKLTRDEVLHYTQVVAGAGNETTGRLIGWLAKVLAEHPDQRREVVEDRSLVPRVVDETLRFEPTGHNVARLVARDYEAYGQTVPAGSAMLLMFGSANRDPRRYENPDVFDIRRNNISHITFGKGVHYCLGANLARLEGRVALEEILNRWPEWDVDMTTAKLAPTSTVRGWERLEVVLP